MQSINFRSNIMKNKIIRKTTTTALVASLSALITLSAKEV